MNNMRRGRGRVLTFALSRCFICSANAGGVFSAERYEKLG